MPRLTVLGLLRTGGVLVAALAAATVLPRLGVPPRAVPDLVVLAVAASAVLRGPVHGALLGLAAGWVVDLVPPAGSPLGVTALLYAAAGAAAGLLRHRGNRGALVPVAAAVLAATVVGAGRLGLAVLGEAPLDPAGAATRLVATVVAALVVVPLTVAVDRALVRRRLA